MYEDARKSGALLKIIQAVNANNGKKPSWARRTVPIDYLRLYEKYSELNQTLKSGLVTLKDFVIEQNRQNHTEFSYRMVIYYFGKIVEYGLKEPIPKKSNKQKGSMPIYKKTQENHIAIYKECLECYYARRANNEKVTWEEVCAKVGTKYGKSSDRVKYIVRVVRREMKEKNYTT